MELNKLAKERKSVKSKWVWTDALLCLYLSRTPYVLWTETIGWWARDSAPPLAFIGQKRLRPHSPPEGYKAAERDRAAPPDSSPSEGQHLQREGNTNTRRFPRALFVSLSCQCHCHCHLTVGTQTTPSLFFLYQFKKKNYFYCLRHWILITSPNC